MLLMRVLVLAMALLFELLLVVLGFTFNYWYCNLTFKVIAVKITFEFFFM